MLLHVSSRAMVLSLVAMASLWLAFHSPLLGILWGLLTGVLSFLTFIAVLFGGICGPVLVPTSRWNDWWGMGWLAYHTKLAREVARADKGQGFELIFYGDSISEDWRGTSGGFPWPIGFGGDAVFKKHFSSKYRAEVLAIAGDQVGHLWWRILNGELPKIKQPKVYTILIGTNDIFAADCNRNETELLATVPGIAERVGEIVRILRGVAPKGQVLIQALLPRGSSSVGPSQWKWPNRYTKPLAAVNERFQAIVAVDPQLHYVDCGAPFIKTQGTGLILDQTLLPDGLHPNAAGMDAMASCLEAAIDPLMQSQYVSLQLPAAA